MGILLLIYLVSAATCATLGVLSWARRGETPAAGSLAVVMVGLTWWSLVDVVGLLTDRAATEISMQLAIYPAASIVVAGFACLCWSLADRDWRPTRRGLLLIAIEPVLVTVETLTNPLHELLVRPMPGGTALFAYGPLYWLHTGYCYLVLAIALLHVLRERRHAPALQTRQLTTLLVSAVPPVLGNLATLLSLAGTRDLSALFFFGTSLLCAHAVFRQGLFEVVPIARARVLEHLEAAVVVLDEQDRLGDVNAAGQALLARAVPPGLPVLGSPAKQALGGLAPVLLGPGGEHRIALTGGGLDVDLRVTALEDRRGRSLGRVLVVHDVSAATDQRRMLSLANDALQEQVVVIERLRADVAEQAVRDPLTGLHNRRHLTTVLAQQIQQATASGEPLSLALLDVDHFKAVNDQHGHAVGDQLLQALGRRLQAVVRVGDSVERYGGEEFVVLLPGLDLPAAMLRADDIRQQCAEVVVPLREGWLHVTLSAGVATTSPGTCTADDLLEAADQALYRAKDAGRDRVAGPLQLIASQRRT